MASVVRKLGIKRKPGYLYFINTDGNVARVKKGSKRKEEVKKTTITREKGFLYFLDKNGDISRARMKRR